MCNRNNLRCLERQGERTQLTQLALFASHKPANFRQRKITCFEGN